MEKDKKGEIEKDNEYKYSTTYNNNNNNDNNYDDRYELRMEGNWWCWLITSASSSLSTYGTSVAAFPTSKEKKTGQQQYNEYC